LTSSFQLHYSPGVDSAFGRYKYQHYLLGGKGSKCVGPTTLSPHVPSLQKFLGTSASYSPQGLYKDCFTFHIMVYIFIFSMK